MANGRIEDYPEAARSIALNLREFCDETLPYPEMIADAARKASQRLLDLAYERDRLREQNHDHAQRRDKTEAELRKRLADAEIALSVVRGVQKRGGDHYWDVAKLAKRPFGLSQADSMEWGRLVAENDRLTTLVEELTHANEFVKREYERQFARQKAEIERLRREQNPLLNA